MSLKSQLLAEGLEREGIVLQLSNGPHLLASIRVYPASDGYDATVAALTWARIEGNEKSFASFTVAMRADLEDWHVVGAAVVYQLQMFSAHDGKIP